MLRILGDTRVRVAVALLLVASGLSLPSMAVGAANNTTTTTSSTSPPPFLYHHGWPNRLVVGGTTGALLHWHDSHDNFTDVYVTNLAPNLTHVDLIWPDGEARWLNDTTWPNGTALFDNMLLYAGTYHVVHVLPDGTNVTLASFNSTILLTVGGGTPWGP